MILFTYIGEIGNIDIYYKSMLVYIYQKSIDVHKRGKENVLPPSVLLRIKAFTLMGPTWRKYLTPFYCRIQKTGIRQIWFPLFYQVKFCSIFFFCWVSLCIHETIKENISSFKAW